MSQLIGLANNCKAQSEGVVATGTSTVETSPVDMAEHDGVCWFLGIGVTDALAVITIEHGDASDLSDAVATDAVLTLAALGDGLVAMVDCYRPLKRYVRLSIVRAVASDYTDIIAVRYSPKGPPAVAPNVTEHQRDSFASPSTA